LLFNAVTSGSRLCTRRGYSVEEWNAAFPTAKHANLEIDASLCAQHLIRQLNTFL
jgi:hypothetical protein